MKSLLIAATLQVIFVSPAGKPSTVKRTVSPMVNGWNSACATAGTGRTTYPINTTAVRTRTDAYFHIALPPWTVDDGSCAAAGCLQQARVLRIGADRGSELF